MPRATQANGEQPLSQRAIATILGNVRRPSRCPHLLAPATAMSHRRSEYTFDVTLPRLRVWEVMADTQHLNELFFGLAASKLVSRDRKRSVLRGTFGILAPEYEEYPWVFEVPRRYENERVFGRGVLRRLATTCVLEEIDDERTRVRYSVDVEGRGPLGTLGCRLVLQRTKVGLRAIEHLLQQHAAGASHQRALQWPPANPQREATLARLHPVVSTLKPNLSSEDAAALELLVEYLADATDADVARMRPYVLARAWGIPRRQALEVFLRSGRAGLLRLSWDLLCPSCDGPTSIASLKDIPREGHCPACDIDFTTSFDRNVEATFSPEPTIRPAERLLFCHGSPNATRGWLAQFVVDAGATEQLSFQLSGGRYRVQAAGAPEAQELDILDDGDVDVDVVSTGDVPVALVSDGEVVTVGGAPIRRRAGEVLLVVENTTAEPVRVQLAHRAFASDAATAADVTSLGLFRELFGGEVLSPDQHVGVGNSAILFTDLVGSTAMYERVGDAAAYGLVRRHFIVLQAAIEERGGRVVKTVGDAVMAAFDLPANAADAGLACIRGLQGMQDGDDEASRVPLQLKVGVHTGPCLAIEANGAIDYFGRTVNIAARVESLARPNELVLSSAVLEDTEVQRWLAAKASEGFDIETDRKQVKGIDGDVEVRRLRLPAKEQH